MRALPPLEERMSTGMMLVLASIAGATEVTWSGGGHAYNPQWSLDGNWLAFESNNNADRVELYIVRLNNGIPSGPATRVSIPGVSSSSFSGGGVYAANPTWIAGGALLFEANNPSGITRIYYTTPGAGASSELLSASIAPGTLAWPSVSPDGTKVVYTSGATGGGDVYLMDRASAKVSAAFRTDTSENAPRFCSNGTTVVFSRKNYGSEDIFTWNLGATETAPLKNATGNGDQTRPACVGDKVVFFSNARGDDKWDIVMVPLAGGEPVTLAKDIRLPLRSTPAVTPDGRAVVWTSSAPATDNNVYITMLDGSGTKTINVGLSAVGEADLVVANGKTWLTFTALPTSGADWRQLHVIDITGQY